MQNFYYLQGSFHGRCAGDDCLWVFIRHCISFCTHVAKLFSILLHEFACSTIGSKCFHSGNWLELILWPSVVALLWADTWNENSYWSWRDLHKLWRSFMDNFASFFFVVWRLWTSFCLQELLHYDSLHTPNPKEYAALLLVNFSPISAPNIWKHRARLNTQQIWRLQGFWQFFLLFAKCECAL